MNFLKKNLSLPRHFGKHNKTNRSFVSKNLKTNTMVKQVLILFLLTVFIQSTFAGEPNEDEKINAMSTPLKSFYKSDNGALIYIRQEGKKVVWLAERFDRKFVAVFNGTYKGDEISGTYCNIPKGKAQGSGSLKVKVSNGGKTLKVTGGNMDGQTLTPIACPTKFPARRKAHYQGNTSNNLTGRWKASNAGQMHLLQEKEVIAGYFFGHQDGANARPATAKVFFGTNIKGKVTMEWFDIPLGISYDNGYCNGKVTFKTIGQHFLEVTDGYIPGFRHERQRNDTSVIVR